MVFDGHKQFVFLTVYAIMAAQKACILHERFVSQDPPYYWSRMYDSNEVKFSNLLGLKRFTTFSQHNRQ